MLLPVFLLGIPAFGQLPPVSKLVVFDGKTNGAYPIRSLVTAGDGGFWGATTGEHTNTTLFKVSPTGNFTTVHRLPNRITNVPGSWTKCSDLIRAGERVYFAGFNYGHEIATWQGGTNLTWLNVRPPAPLNWETAGYYIGNAGSLTLGPRDSLYGLSPFELFSLDRNGVARREVNFSSAGPTWIGSEFDYPLTRSVDGKSLYGAIHRSPWSERDVKPKIVRWTPGVGLETVYTFEGKNPSGSLGGALLHAADGYVYGETDQGIFKLDPVSRSIRLLDYDRKAVGSGVSGLIQGRDGVIYGRTIFGGGGVLDQSPRRFGGTVFKITSSGAVEPISGLPDFVDPGSGKPLLDNPYHRYTLIQGLDGSLYGTVKSTPQDRYGIIFKVDANLLKDAQPPVVRITEPSQPKIFTNQPRLVLRGTATDDLEPVRLQHGIRAVDSKGWKEGVLTASSKSPKTKSWTVALPLSGEAVEGEENVVFFRVFDKVGKVSKSGELRVVYDRKAPNSIPGRPIGETQGNLSVSSATDLVGRAETKLQNFTLLGTADDKHGIARVDFRLRRPGAGVYGDWKAGVLQSRNPPGHWQHLSHRNWTVTGDLKERGSWMLQVRVTDLAGNAATWTISIKRL